MAGKRHSVDGEIWVQSDDRDGLRGFRREADGATLLVGASEVREGRTTFTALLAKKVRMFNMRVNLGLDPHPSAK